MNKNIKDKRVITKVIVIAIVLILISLVTIINLKSHTTFQSNLEYTSYNDEITYVNINVKGILRDESKVTEAYDAILKEATYTTQTQINNKVTITPDLLFGESSTYVGNITKADVSNSEDDSSIAILTANPQAAEITAVNGQFEYQIIWDVASGVNKFTVKFVDTEGNSVKDDIEVSQDNEGNPLKYNQDINLDDYIPVESDFTGKAFVGWELSGTPLRSNLSESYLGTTFTIGTEDLTFTAKFDGANTSYSLKFWKQKDGGNQAQRNPDNYQEIDLGEDANPISARIGDTITVEALRRTGASIVEKHDGGVNDATRIFYGYKLGYIYLGDTEITEESITVTNDMEINFYVVKILSVLTTIAGDGIDTTTPTTQTIEFGSRVTIDCEVKDGYTWSHWLDLATNTEFSSNQEFTFAMNSANLNLKAIATAEDYTITLNLDGGTASWTTKTYNIKSEAISLPTPTKQGYTFAGWTGDGITTPQTNYSVPKGTTGNKTYTANWTAAEVTYKVNHYQQKLGGDATKTSTQAEINSNFDLVKTDSYTATNGTEGTAGVPNYYPGFVTPANKTLTLTGDPNKDVINYFYVRKNIAISIRSDAGIKQITGQKETYIYGEEVSFVATVNGGYTFDTWTGVDGLDTGHGLNNTNLTFNVPDYNLEIEAKTTPGRYTIEYNLDGGTVTPPNPTTYTVGDSFTITNPTKEGYEFGGWTGTDLTNPTKNLSITNKTFGDKSYTATWLLIDDYSYQVNYWLEKANADSSKHDTTNYTKSTESHKVDFEGTGTESVTETPVDIDGYTTPEAITKVVSSKTITFDFYYPRETYILAVKPDNQDAFTSVIGSDTYAWGDTVNIEAKTVYGYEFDKWDGVDDIEDFTPSTTSTSTDAKATFTMPENNFTITAISKVGITRYDYIVKYWFEKVTSISEEPNSTNFEVDETYTKNASVNAGTSVTITPEEIEYYEPLNNTVTETIDSDGKTINVYYLRTKYKAIFEANELHNLDEETALIPWGRSITIGVTNKETGEYDTNCTGFTQTSGTQVEGELDNNPMTFIMPKEDIAFRALWNNETPDTNDVSNQTTNDTANEVSNETKNETKNETTNEVANETKNETTNKTTNETTNETTNDTTNETTNDTTNQTTNETTNETGNIASGSSQGSGSSSGSGSQSGSSQGSGSSSGSEYSIDMTSGNAKVGDDTKSSGKLPQTGISNTTIKAIIAIILAMGVGTFVLTKKNKDIR